LQVSKTARFDFGGHLLSPNSVIPVYQGLHHHGEEPALAGYTTDELMLMCRSENVGQRTIACNTLAKILTLAKLGIYDSCFDMPLIQSLINSSIIPLIRVGLDDHSVSVLISNTILLESLLHSSLDEISCDRVAEWWGGILQPSLTPSVLAENVQVAMDDDALAKVDVVKVRCFHLFVHSASTCS
uniref:RPAP1_C domain-containing protein n=1 Tax=Soboliphyme baturini TaxID=241478 RepID=A0A183JB90_9BILA